MNCSTCKQAINTYLDGYLPPGREHEIFAHLRNCPECERYYEDLTEIYDRMAEPDREVPGGFSASWRKEVAYLAHKKRKVNLRVLVPALAACVCGVFVMSMLVFGAGGYGLNPSAGQSLTIRTEQNQTGTTSTQEGQQDQANQPQSQEAAGGQSQRQQEQQAQGGSLLEDSGNWGEQGDRANNAITDGNISDQPNNGGAAQEETPSAPDTDNSMPYGEAASTVGEAYRIDARNKQINRQELLDYALEHKIAITETEDSVFLEAETSELNELLAHFDLEEVFDLTLIEILL